MKTLQTVIYYRGETPMRGAVVRIDRKSSDGVREDVQRFDLIGWEAVDEDGGDCGRAWKLEWATGCTECASAFEVKTNNYTKNLPRRCKACRKANPYDSTGWAKRPRNRFTREDPSEEAAARGKPAEAVAADPWKALSSAQRIELLQEAKAALGSGATRDAVEQEAKALASLF